MIIHSVQVGHVITEGDPRTRDLLRRQWTTGFYKLPIDSVEMHSPGRESKKLDSQSIEPERQSKKPAEVTPLGLAGDAVADERNHGGPDKAILCYAVDHYRLWALEHPELKMSGGAMGENLTVSGGDESKVCIGDRFRIGSCELEVSQPRQPCWKIARRWGIKTLTKEVAASGRTGWYLRVIQQGNLRAGQTFQLVHRPNPDWTVARANDVLFGREVDRLAVVELMSLKELADAWRKDLA